MHAFVQHFDCIGFSVTYDAITIYPKLVAKPRKLAKKFSSAMMQCEKLSFWDQKIYDFYTVERIGVERFILRGQDDHDYYHQDPFQMEDDHAHIKFREMITLSKLESILSVFVEYEFMTDDEKNQCLKNFSYRYQNDKLFLDKAISLENKEKAVKDIIQYIFSCSDNDVLAVIHEYLLEEKFDVLRVANESEPTIYQGENNHHKIVPTSKAWADIEKAIELQMGHNMIDNTQFTSFVAQDRASQFSSLHPFFSIKHKQTASQPESKSYCAFRNADKNTFETSYEKHRVKFR